MKKDIKIVALISSGKINGNSARLAREVLKGAEKEGAIVTEIFLPKYKLDYCTGCLTCLKGECPIDDDFEVLKKLVSDADGIILSSPTFAGAANACMKNFIDRIGLFENMTSSLFGGKYVVGISTAASMGAKKVAKGLAYMVTGSIFQRGYVSGFLGVKLGHRDVKDTNALSMASELGRKISRDIKNSKKYYLQNLFMRMMNCFILKSSYKKIIFKGKEDNLKNVYSNLKERGLVE
jgi:multimeric flavodoxin WrbA